MKILMLANARAVHTKRWARALAERGHDVTVISIREATIPGVTVISRPVGPVDGGPALWPLLSYVRLLLTLPFDLRRLKPDVVNPHYCVTHGAIAALARARPRVVNVWGSDLIWDGAAPMPWWRRAVVRLSLKGADAIVSTSRFMAEEVERLVPGHPPITLVPFGVDTSRFHPGERAADAPVRIGFVKTFAPKYAPDVFIEAAAIVARERPDIEFVMAGRGPLLDAMGRLAAERGLEGRVSFLGFVPHDEVAEFMRGLDILVNCSRTESFGVVICEASATALPVIATDVGGVRETLKNGETGILVPRDDPPALAAGMLRLAASAELRERMGAAGRAFVKGAYTWNVCVAKMEDLLQSCSIQKNGQNSPSHEVGQGHP